MRRLLTGALASALLATGCERETPPPTVSFLAEELPGADKDAPSAPLSEFRAESWTLGDESRLSLVSPLASRISFPLTLPDAPVLRFGAGLFPLVETESDRWERLRNVEFRVAIERGDEVETVFTEPIRRHEAGSWMNHEVDLSRFAGETVRLTLSTAPPDRFLGDPGRLRAARAQFLPLWGHPVVESSAAPAPGGAVILISLDCLRARSVGAYGYEPARTPNIDAFAAEGVVFENALTTAPSTLPSHTTMLTGLTPLMHEANTWRPRHPAAPYLPEVLAERGFETHGVVTGPYLSQSFGLQSGFHSYQFFYDPRASVAVDAAFDVLSRTSRRPQFLFLHLFDAHMPYLAPREFLPNTGEGRIDVSSLLERTAEEKLPSDDDRRALVALYDAEIAYLDSEVGRFLDELRQRGLYDSSLILMTADHGEAFYEHGHRQHSRTLYEELVHIPLIVKWPTTTGHARVATPVSLIDVFPTILEHAGVTGELSPLGVDLARTARGESPGARTLISEFEWLLPDRTIMKIAMRHGSMKYIASLEGAPGEQMGLEHLEREEIYSLSEDPLEANDLSDESRGTRDDFRERLANYLSTVYGARSAGGQRRDLDEGLLRQLESLGYVVR